MTDNFSARKLLYLGLSHLSFLKTAEKFFVAKKLKDINELLSLSIMDLALLINRPLRTRLFSSLKELEAVIEADYKVMKRYDIKSVSMEEDSFPYLLREIADPPQFLFYRGFLPVSEKKTVAIVGTRRPSNDGIYCTLELAKEYAQAGIPVVSGLAMGIDTYAHKGCVESGGQSFAVLACGVENIYPRSNVKLAAKLMAEGGLISEYPPGTEAKPFRFPQRNRIVSGLARAIVVVEAPQKSGALITADFALDQGRDVFVCSKMLSSSRNQGGKQLNYDGAYPINKATEVFDYQYDHKTTEAKNELFCFKGDHK